MNCNKEAKIIDIKKAKFLIDEIEKLLEKYNIKAAEFELCLDGNTFEYDYSSPEIYTL